MPRVDPRQCRDVIGDMTTPETRYHVPVNGGDDLGEALVLSHMMFQTGGSWLFFNRWPIFAAKSISRVSPGP